ncbi:MAG: hypothetical protein PHC61_08610 [Chitinivibrionales bacterium]|nr:hypothetical protein [Chitinivibrionales bacterium]
MQEWNLHFLDNSVSILVLDRDVSYQARYKDIFASCPFYSPLSASTPAEAEKILRSGRRIFLAITELLRDESQPDEYFLLKQFSENVPFVVVSSMDSLEKGFTVNSYGAVAIELKPIKNADTFLDLINDYFLDSLITQGRTTIESNYLVHYITVLKKRLPLTVEEWAEYSGLPLPFLIRNWQRRFHVDPSAIICLYTLFRAAISQNLRKPPPLVPDEIVRNYAQKFAANENYYRNILSGIAQ